MLFDLEIMVFGGSEAAIRIAGVDDQEFRSFQSNALSPSQLSCSERRPGDLCASLTNGESGIREHQEFDCEASQTDRTLSPNVRGALRLLLFYPA